MSLYQSHCKAYKNTHTSSYQTSSHKFSLVGKAVCQPMGTLGTEEGGGCSVRSWEGVYLFSHNNQSNLSKKKTAPETVTNIPQPPISSPLSILRTTGGVCGGGQKALA